jgi:hypothetical protein
MILEGMSNPLVGEDGMNQTMYARAWENWTTTFVREFWALYFQSPFVVDNVGTTLVSAQRLPPSQRRRRQQQQLRYLQTNNVTANETENTGNDTDIDTDNISSSPPPTADDTVLPVRIVYRQQIDFRLVDEERANEIFGTDWQEALFLVPFLEAPFVYTNQLAIVTESTTAITLVSTGLDFSNLPPTIVPSTTPSESPTITPSSWPSPIPELNEPDKNTSERRIIGFVVAVVVISVFVAAGYLYYLVRKEDRQPIVGDLPDELTGRHYYVDDPAREEGVPRPTSFDSSLQQQPPTAVGHHHQQQQQQLYHSRSTTPDNMGNGFQGGTISTVTTSATTDGNTTRMPPPPMAVLDDVFAAHPPHDGVAEFGGTASSEELTDTAAAVAPSPRPSTSEMDHIGLVVNPSFDSADASAASATYDMTGFQMNVQNLDDL